YQPRVLVLRIKPPLACINSGIPVLDFRFFLNFPRTEARQSCRKFPSPPRSAAPLEAIVQTRRASAFGSPPRRKTSGGLTGWQDACRTSAYVSAMEVKDASQANNRMRIGCITAAHHERTAPIRARPAAGNAATNHKIA